MVDRKRACRSVLIRAGLAYALVLAGTAPLVGSPEDSVRGTARAAWEDLEGRKKAGASPVELSDAVQSWVEKLWAEREAERERPRDESARNSAAEALHLLAHFGRSDQLAQTAESLALDDPAWDQALPFLLEHAQEHGDYSYVQNKASQVLSQAQDAEAKASAAFVLGQAHWQAGLQSEARRAFQRVSDEQPGGWRARAAELSLYEMLYLSKGQTAPKFVAVAIDGRLITSSDLKGKAVLLNFWATSCSICIEKLPQIEALLEKYSRDDFAVVGVSLDKDKDVLARFVQTNSLAAPQICDGEGDQGLLARLFAVTGVPTSYLLSPSGKIIAKNLSGEELEAAVGKLVASDGNR